jgi:hypothetical protein
LVYRAANRAKLPDQPVRRTIMQVQTDLKAGHGGRCCRCGGESNQVNIGNFATVINVGIGNYGEAHAHQENDGW